MSSFFSKSKYLDLFFDFKFKKLYKVLLSFLIDVVFFGSMNVSVKNHKDIKNNKMNDIFEKLLISFAERANLIDFTAAISMKEILYIWFLESLSDRVEDGCRSVYCKKGNIEYSRERMNVSKSSIEFSEILLDSDFIQTFLKCRAFWKFVAHSKTFMLIVNRKNVGLKSDVPLLRVCFCLVYSIKINFARLFCLFKALLEMRLPKI